MQIRVNKGKVEVKANKLELKRLRDAHQFASSMPRGIGSVELWKQMLANPKYDNLGPNSPEPPKSILANTMASAMASMIPANNTQEILDRFGEALKARLMNPIAGKEFYETCLAVDYGPDQTLADVAKEVGLKMEFPWKTVMHLSEVNVSVRNGYGAPYVYHYPLGDDDWFETTLCGDDIQKIIGLVASGVLTKELEAAVPVDAPKE
jgi:hypothetical protein